MLTFSGSPELLFFLCSFNLLHQLDDLISFLCQLLRRARKEGVKLAILDVLLYQLNKIILQSEIFFCQTDFYLLEKVIIYLNRKISLRNCAHLLMTI